MYLDITYVSLVVTVENLKAIYQLADEGGDMDIDIVWSDLVRVSRASFTIPRPFLQLGEFVDEENANTSSCKRKIDNAWKAIKPW